MGVGAIYSTSFVVYDFEIIFSLSRCLDVPTFRIEM